MFKKMFLGYMGYRYYDVPDTLHPLQKPTWGEPYYTTEKICSTWSVFRDRGRYTYERIYGK